MWDENKDRFVFLHTNLPVKQQINSIINDIDIHKDILAIRFPQINEIKNNKIINNIISSKGFSYDNNVWCPKEIWIYCMM